MKILAIFEKMEYHWSKPHLNLFKTIYFNCRVLPLREAVKLPIYIYGSVSLYWLQGKVIFEQTPIRRGMVKLGRNTEFFNGVKGGAFILLGKNSRLIFEGACAIGNDYSLRVAADATLRLGAYTFFGSSVKLICVKGITIGQFTRIAYESQLVDSNFHYTYHLSSKTIHPKEQGIVVGAYNWIGNRTTLSKGAHTKPYTIVCSHSMLNRDYTTYPNAYPTLGGTPAKELASGMKRIYSIEIERELNSYFKSHPTNQPLVYGKELVDNYESIKKWFDK